MGPRPGRALTPRKAFPSEPQRCGVRGAKGVLPALPNSAGLLGLSPQIHHPWPCHPSRAPTTAWSLVWGFPALAVPPKSSGAVWVGAPQIPETPPNAELGLSSWSAGVKPQTCNPELWVVNHLLTAPQAPAALGAALGGTQSPGTGTCLAVDGAVPSDPTEHPVGFPKKPSKSAPGEAAGLSHPKHSLL